MGGIKLEKGAFWRVRKEKMFYIVMRGMAMVNHYNHHNVSLKNLLCNQLPCEGYNAHNPFTHHHHFS